jgi:hypothetical protein
MFFSTPPVFSACPGGDSRHVDDTSFYKARAIGCVSFFQLECEVFAGACGRLCQPRVTTKSVRVVFPARRFGSKCEEINDLNFCRRRLTRINAALIPSGDNFAAAL